MGKSAGSKQEVTDYRMSLHYGICSGPVVLREILIDDKTVWQGRMAVQGAIDINFPTLFGGNLKEGGVVGQAYFLPGTDDQIMPTGLAQRFGLTSETCPAFRGVASIFFVGNVNQPGGFLWTTNSPFIRAVKVKVERVPVGLDPAYAVIGSTGLSANFINYGVTIDGQSATLKDGVATAVGAHTVSRTVSTTSGVETYVIDGSTLTVQRWIDGSNGEHLSGTTITLDGNSGTFGTVGRIVLGDVTVAVNGSLVSYTQAASANRNANPIHMIYENLTNQSWGMAAPSYLIDKANFEDVAKKIYAENFPLSIFWTQQDTVEAYTSEIIDHILATLFVNPQTGLLSIMLLRDDYDFNSLRVLDPSNSKMTSFKRKLFGETINEIVVTWTNPETEKGETVTAQDDANIEIQGAPVSDSRNYYGIRSADLAARVAARDSRSASAPLATMEMEVNRSGWNLLPGSVIRVNWPKYKLNDVVCRIIKIAYGKAGDPTIKISLLEDIFSLSHQAPTPPPSSGWAGVDVYPSPMEFTRLLTLPHFLTTKEGVPELTYPDVVAGMLAYQPGGSTIAYDLFTERPMANGQMTWQSVGTKSIIGRSAMLTPLYAEATTQVTGLPLTGEARGPVVAGLVMFGDGAESDMEIALLQAFDGTNWTVKRGVLDTTPRYWPIGTPVWFLPPNATIGDSFEIRSVGETPEYRPLPRTSKGILSIDDAPSVLATMTARPHAPLRPANVKINGQGFGDISAAALTNLHITWETRNRLTEDTQILAWDAGSVTPEYLQMSIVTIFRENGQEMVHWRGMYSETSLDVPIAYLQQEKNVYVRVSSERNGISSLQSHGLWVRGIPQIANPSPPPPSSEGSAPPAPPPTAADPTPDPVAGVQPTNPVRPGGGGDYPGSWEIT